MTFNYLIVPGLNQAPEIYQDILSTYSGGEILKFPCNSNKLDNFVKTPIEDYISILESHLNENSYDYIFCHSLGSLIMSSLLIRGRSLDSKVKLISPAFKGRVLSKIIPFLSSELMIPSFNRRHWRVHPYCKVDHYQQIIKIQNSLEFGRLNDFENVEIIFDPRDEMIDLHGVEGIKKRREHYSKNFPRHLCIDYIEKTLFTLLR